MNVKLLCVGFAFILAGEVAGDRDGTLSDISSSPTVQSNLADDVVPKLAGDKDGTLPDISSSPTVQSQLAADEIPKLAGDKDGSHPDVGSSPAVQSDLPPYATTKLAGDKAGWLPDKSSSPAVQADWPDYYAVPQMAGNIYSPLPDISLSPDVQSELPDYAAPELFNLNNVFHDFNAQINMATLIPALEKTGEAGIRMIDALTTLVGIIQTGQYINIFAIGSVAKKGYGAVLSVQGSMAAIRALPAEIPFDQELSFILDQMARILQVLQCLDLSMAMYCVFPGMANNY